MYISESNLRKIIRNELLKEGIFDDIVDWASQNTSAGVLAKSVHDYFKYGTLPDVSKLIGDPSHKTDSQQDFIYD